LSIDSVTHFSVKTCSPENRQFSLWQSKTAFGTLRKILAKLGLTGKRKMRGNLPILVICFGLEALPGCHFTGLRDPVPATLATSRRLSQDGRESLERGDNAKAEELLAQAVKTCPSDADAHRYYAEALWARGAQAEAIAQLEEAIKLSGDNPELRIRLADMYLAGGSFDKARQSAESALALDGKSPAAWAALGRLHRCEGDAETATDRRKAGEFYRLALADDHRALGYAPQDRALLAEEAEVYRRLAEPQQALDTMQSLAETYSPGEEPAWVLFWQGRDYLALSRFDDAAASFNGAAAHGMRTADNFYCLAEAQHRSGRPAEAASALQQALKIDPRHLASQRLLNEIQVAQQTDGVMRR
jgi:tetratricopeptide (TPR) repeat protein